MLPSSHTKCIRGEFVENFAVNELLDGLIFFYSWVIFFNFYLFHFQILVVHLEIATNVKFPIIVCICTATIIVGITNIFKASALWADAFYKLKCPYVCLCVCLFTF